jgi:2-polyprenyl-6-methoxyphenol hydroxylase-like FAD-dependent oxidoreductase
MSASYGQAANFALEDAATLAACIRDGDDLMEALKDYSKKRLDRCIEMQARSAERAAKAMKGEQVEDVSKWIFQWEIA